MATAAPAPAQMPSMALITGCASNVRFDAGAYLFREGENADTFFIIRHGKVSVELYGAQRGTLLIETIQEGDVLGWSWLVPPYKWRFDAKAIELTRAIALDGVCLRTKCDEDHSLGYEVWKRFAHVIEQRLHATRMRLLDLYATDA